MTKNKKINEHKVKIKFGINGPVIREGINNTTSIEKRLLFINFSSYIFNFLI